MKKLISLFFFAFFVLALSSSTFAQGKFGKIGKKFTHKDANVLFGNVVSYVKISRADLLKAIEGSDEYITFTVKNNKAHVLNSKFNSLLTGEKVSISPKQKAFVLSKDVLVDFVETSTAQEFSVESRADVYTISDDNTVLEKTLACPPVCPN